MTCFEMVKYHAQKYPDDIPLRLEEIAAHFDVSSLCGSLERSLHTEYSYGKRRWDSQLLTNYPEILSAQKDGIPQLWKNENWGSQFAGFIIALVGNDIAPSVIEIHPPFSDYTDMNGFIRSYSCFEEKVKEVFPNVTILIENRCGSLYRGGRFLISKNQDVISLCNLIVRSDLNLMIAYDVPQIFTAHMAKAEHDYMQLLETPKTIRHLIGGVHLWGKRPNISGRLVAHNGDLNSLFRDKEVKQHFLESFCNCFNDGITRKMVLEVNSGKNDLFSIINDLRDSNIRFV